MKNVEAFRHRTEPPQREEIQQQRFRRHCQLKEVGEADVVSTRDSRYRHGVGYRSYLESRQLAPGTVNLRGDCTTEKSIWHIVKDCAKGSVCQNWPLMPASDVRSSVPRCRRRTGTDPVPAGTCLGSNNRAIPWLQAADSIGGQ
jgi:hypothetical protein